MTAVLVAVAMLLIVGAFVAGFRYGVLHSDAIAGMLGIHQKSAVRTAYEQGWRDALSDERVVLASAVKLMAAREEEE